MKKIYGKEGKGNEVFCFDCSVCSWDVFGGECFCGSDDADVAGDGSRDGGYRNFGFDCGVRGSEAVH